MRSIHNQRLGVIVCEGCKEPFVPYRKDQKIHSRHDRAYSNCAQKRAHNNYVPADLYNLECPRCGTWFRPMRGDQRYCSADCREADSAEQFLQLTVKIPRNLLTSGEGSGILVLTVVDGKVASIERGGEL